MMTDNEIIKAFEHLVKNASNHIPITGKMLLEDVLGVLNRLKSANEKNERIIELADKTIKTQSAEIERYLHSIKLLEKDVQTAKSEAIKEFAERLTDKADLIKVNAFDSKWAISQDDIDNLLKEMVGDDNA